MVRHRRRMRVVLWKATETTVSGSGNSPRRRSSKGKTRIVRPEGAGSSSSSSSRAKSAAAREQEARRKQLLRMLAGAAAIAIVGVIVLIAFNTFGGDDDDGSDGAIVVPTSVAASAWSNTGTSHILGDENAPVTIVEWADYQCPFCGDFARTVQSQMVEEFVNTGQVKFEFRDFAFLGDESTAAAGAAWCAGDQNKFGEFHDTLFSNQDGENEGAFSNERLLDMGTQLGLDATAFENCIARNTYESQITASLDEGDTAGVTSTPTFFINGEKVVGIDGYDDLRERIEAALNS